MKTVIQAIQERLSNCEKLRYVAENWGQLESENPPMRFPCALVDISEISYTQSLNRSQQGIATLTVDIANKTQRNVSINSSEASKEAYYEFYDILDKVSSLLHGYASAKMSPLRRTATQKQTRKDGIKACRITFTFPFTDQL